MTAAPHDVVPGAMPDPAQSLRAIRAALVVRQDREGAEQVPAGAAARPAGPWRDILAERQNG